MSVVSMVFINGHFSANLSDLSLLPPSVLYENEKNGFFLSIPENISIEPFIHCVFLRTPHSHVITSLQNVIVAGANSRVTLIEEYVGQSDDSYFMSSTTHICAEENATVHYHKIQAESAQAIHMANIAISQKQNSSVRSFSLALGSRAAREDIRVVVQERGAECHLHGLYHVTEDHQQIDNYLHVNHVAAQGASSMLYKGILDKKSRALFNGKVFVHKDAQHINAHQANHNLLLSPWAAVTTKPELEIYADDVKCAHGATVGQLDRESLFYLRARGIEEKQAVALLTHAFATDVINKIENRLIREYVQQRAGYYDE